MPFPGIPRGMVRGMNPVLIIQRCSAALSLSVACRFFTSLAEVGGGFRLNSNFLDPDCSQP
jgi:hypothetical protein